WALTPFYIEIFSDIDPRARSDPDLRRLHASTSGKTGSSCYYASKSILSYHSPTVTVNSGECRTPPLHIVPIARDVRCSVAIVFFRFSRRSMAPAPGVFGRSCRGGAFFRPVAYPARALSRSGGPRRRPRGAGPNRVAGPACAGLYAP